MLGAIYFCSKGISSWKRTKTSILSYCKQKRGTCLVDITKNCELYILLMTLRLTLKFWLTIGNAILKDGKQQIGKIKFDPNRDHAPLKYNKKINVPINRQ